MNSVEIFQNETDLNENQVITKDQSFSMNEIDNRIQHIHLLTEKVLDEQVSIKRNYYGHIPEHLEHVVADQECTLSISFDNHSVSDSVEFIFENIIIKYKATAGKEETNTVRNKVYKSAYLNSYVMVGIPTERYQWLLNKVKREYKIPVECRSRWKYDDYTWVSARILQNNSVRCYIYANENQDKVCIGSLFKVMTSLKSNVSGYGAFRIQLCKDQLRPHFLFFTLISFQLVDETKVDCPAFPVIPVAPSQRLMEALTREKIAYYTSI